MEDFGPLFRTQKQAVSASKTGLKLKTVGLFAGIGGIELGLERAGHSTSLLCEIEPHANAVLQSRFPKSDLWTDVRSLKKLPKVDLVSAGFPCQDLSQAGKTAGIRGQNSGLVGEVFRLLSGSHRSPKWLLLENVPFMLQLDRGRAMSFLTKALSDLGFTWAYRTVDARAFGVPQRRKRVIFLASKTEDPRNVLFSDDAGEINSNALNDRHDLACGFYWTEGIRGLGWAVDAVPTIKGGSGIGIPSPPAIWMRQAKGEIVTPDIRDAERLQGFPANWTLQSECESALSRKATAARWKLVGNAVCVPVAEWVGKKLASPGQFDDFEKSRKLNGTAWPSAAFGHGRQVVRIEASTWPIRAKQQHLADFLNFETKPLSERATAGFLERTTRSQLRFAAGFLDALRTHLNRVRSKKPVARTPSSSKTKRGKKALS